MDYLTSLETLIKAISDVLTAGVAIISFSLFIYAVTFKLHDRVTISFTFLLLCIVVIFGADAFLTVTNQESLLRFLLKIHWSGLIILPTAYFHFSDALLSTTGKPSRGRRRIVGLVCSTISLIFCGLLFTDLLVGNVIMDQPPAPFLERTVFNDFFSVFFLVAMVMSWYNYIRAFRRTKTSTSRRRMFYLITSAIGPVLGSFPYLLYGSGFAAMWPVLFWLLSVIFNSLVFITLIAMTYAVSFFGFPWADRVVKSRLFRWVMRGPITASVTLGVTTIVTRMGKQWNIDVSAILVLSMVAVIVLLEYFITLFAPIWERILFSGSDRQDLEKIRLLEDRLLTSNDIRQFQELILATLCDLLQVQGAGLLVKNGNALNLDIEMGRVHNRLISEKEEIFKFIENQPPENGNVFINWKKDIFLCPLFYPLEEEREEFLGIILVEDFDFSKLDKEKNESLKKLIKRISLALHDRKIQENLFVSLEMLTPQVSIIQDLLAFSRLDQQKIFNENPVIESSDLENWVKDALNHMWGGPKISENPILQLRIVEEKVKSEDETPVNALREILKTAINRLRPEGERQYTNEWILFNLLELKYLAGWKVKDIARKLSLSEADLYRKQRIAINAVSNQIINMEKEIIDHN